jgi:hypothetical protein
MAARSPVRSGGRLDEARRRIALEAARLMSEHGIRDFHLAKRKAAERLNVRDEAQMPKNSEVEAALREHQRLFQAEVQPQRLRELREAAREAMRFFAPFDPRLVGAVLEGTADEHSAICLHLFAESPENVIEFLREHGISHAEQGRRVRLARDKYQEFPVLVLAREQATFDLTVFPRDAIRQAPFDHVDERPQRRASLSAVEALLAASQD